MNSPTIVQKLAAFSVQVRRDGLPAELRKDVARRVLDVFGNSLGARNQPAAQSVSRLVTSWGGCAESTAIGTGLRLPAPAAALLNGTLAHSLDFDDTHLPSVLHPSASVVPAALAVGESRQATGAQVLDAAGIGIEIAVRLGMGGYNKKLGNSEFFERGLHATSITGTVGAAVAAAVLMGLDAEGIAHAAGIACSMGAGLLEANRTGGTVKRVHCGWAAHAGVTAAQLAEHGLTGPPTVIEGRFGFLYAFCGEHANTNAVVDRLGEHWELPGIFFKPYPCNHFTHAGIDAARQIRSRGVNPADIVSIELGVPSPVLRTIAQPADAKARPGSGYQAAFSGPYTVAAALTGGSGLGLSHEDFTDAAAADETRLALAAKVSCVADARCDEIFPHQFPAVLTVRLGDGTEHVARVDVNRGGPGNPLSSVELAQKFASNASASLDRNSVQELAAATLDLAKAAGIEEVMATVRM